MQPSFREAPAATFLVSNHEVTITQIPEVATQAVGPLFKALQTAGLEPSGPMNFFFYNFSGGPSDPFTLGIAVPVASKGTVDGPYEWRKAPAFPCLSTDYVGSMRGIKEAWDALFETMRAQGYQCSGEEREVYKHWVDFDSPENITELQIGVVPA